MPTNAVRTPWKAPQDRTDLALLVGIIPLEVIVRNTAAGSMAKQPGLTEGTVLNTPVFELSYKLVKFLEFIRKYKYFIDYIILLSGGINDKDYCH
jgi:phosphoribosylaminoimidazole-succinocarboxamide synthase